MDHSGMREPDSAPLGDPLTPWGAVILILAVGCIASGFVVLALAYGLWRLVAKLRHRPGVSDKGQVEHGLPEPRCVQA